MTRFGSLRSCVKRTAAVVVVLCAPLIVRAASVSPSGMTDGTDAAAIQAAINAAAEGGVVTLADGTYNLTTPVLLNRAVELVGNDADRSKVVFDGANKYRLVEVTAAGASAHGIRFERGYSGETDNYYHGPVYITAGVVSNCTVKMSKNGKYCGGVGMGGGMLVDCDITGCGTDDGGGASYGGALRLNGETCIADHLVITNNSAKTGAGVYLNKSGAKLLNSLVANNGTGGYDGAGIYAISGTVVSNCVIRNNSGKAGGGIYGACHVYDSLIVGNSGTTGGGFYKTGGTMRGCTVVGNTASVKGAGVYQAGGSIVDSILWHNGSSVYLTQEDSLSLAGGTCTYTCAALAGSGEGNVTDRPPAFVDVANGDYRLTAASPCRGAAQDGVSDLGYHAFVPAATPRVAFKYTIVDGKAPAETTFTAVVEGATATGYVWDFGDKSGTGVTLDATTNHTFAAAGRYTVKLTVKTAGGDLTYTVENAVNLGSDTVYVGKLGSNTFPYADWDTAATDIQAAIESVICSDAKPGKVCLSNDTYTITKVITLDKPIELVGNDADRSKVRLDAGNVNGVHLLYVRHAKAFAHGLRLQNSRSTLSNHGYNYYCGPVLITDGVVSNCTVAMSQSSLYCGGVGMGGGTIVDCDITGCSSTDGMSARVGGALRLYGATCVADRLVITNNSSKAGAGVYLKTSGAKLLNSLVANNSAGTDTGGGIYAESGTIVSNCVIRNNTAGSGAGIYGACNVYDSTIVSNTASSATGGGIWQTGGTVARCVIADCTANTLGGGVYKTGGTLDHVTVVRCNAKATGSGVNQTSGSVKNSIVYENGNLTGYSASDIVSTAGTISFSCARELTDETSDNIAKDPLFRAINRLDVRLFSSSPCIGKAENDTDMGAIPWVYDPDEPVTIIITVTTDGSCYPVTATYGCEITGKLPAGITNYVWTFGDGTSASAPTNGISHVYAKPGVYSVALKLELANGQTKESSRENAVAVYSDVAWVDIDNPHPQAPYDTEDKAANTLQAALDAVYVPDGGYGTVKVKAGRFTSGFGYDFKRGIHLVSASGKRDVIIDNGVDGFGNPKISVKFSLQHENALVSGFVVSNAWVYGSNWGIFDVESGTVTNCATVNTSGGYAGGGAARGAKAKIVDCSFERGYSNDSNGGGRHGMGGLLVEGGLVENCVVTNCSAGANVGGIQLKSGTVRNTTVVKCSGRGGVNQQDGLMENCRILANTGSHTSYSAGVVVSGGTLRNSLVAGNSSATIPSGIRATGAATIESCTIADNAGTTAGIVSVDGAKWYNVISWNNAGGDSYGAAQLDHCLVGTDPRFRRPAKGDYQVWSQSPARDGGVERDWMAGATDLAGNPRILNKVPDIGCYEKAAVGLVLLVR